MLRQTPWTYELLVKDIYDSLLKRDGIVIHHRHKYTGRRSGQVYEIDLSFEFHKAAVRFLVLIECKQYARLVEASDAIELAYKLDDIGAHKGILVTTRGFQRGVFKIAIAAGIALVKVYRPGEWDLNIADIGEHSEYKHYFADYEFERNHGELVPIEPVPIMATDFERGLQKLMISSDRKSVDSDRSALISSAAEEAQAIAVAAVQSEEVDLLAKTTGGSPDALLARFNLARLYHRATRYQDAIRTYLDLLGEDAPLPSYKDEAGGALKAPEVLYYNLACACVRAGEHDAGIEWLRRLKRAASEASRRYFKYAETDPDLAPLKGRVDFIDPPCPRIAKT
jgi:hypothetical protein